MRKSSILLEAKLNKWLKEFLVQKKFKRIKANYFSLKNLPNPTKEVYALINGSQLSKFDPIFKKIASKYNFDWRLLASVAYQESKFNPYVKGFGGAFGMMQFIPSTARKFGINPSSPPETQINAGMKKISRDIASWQSIPDKNQREKFALGTYNAGRSHIEDAQRLAMKYGLNHLIWDENVEIMVLNLSKSRYYRDPVVRNGALKNARTYHYVRSVYQRYEEWKEVYK
jgi:membrane-bound lytic murein transglycosylase F